MKPGVMILEVMVSMMIATVLMTASFTIYNQISKTAQILQRITSTDTQVMILQDRLQKDLVGITPLWFNKEQYDHLKAGQKKDDEQQPDEQQPSDSQHETNNFFYATNKENELDFFTFMTINAMQMYDSADQRFVRVVYKLEKKDKTFTLLRKEIHQASNKIDTESFTKKQSFYPIVSNISKLEIEYGFINQPKHSKKKKDESSDKTIEVKWLPDWGIVTEKTKTNEYKPALPETIKVKIQFLKENKQQHTYELFCSIPIDSTNKFNSVVQKKHKTEHKHDAKKTPDHSAKAKGDTHAS